LRIIAVICLLIAFRSFSQTSTIKVRKPLSQAEAPWNVTLCGKYSGSITKAEILADPKLKISFNTIGLRIISYEIVHKKQGKVSMHLGSKTDTLYAEVIKEISLTDENTNLWVQDIKAVSKNNDTIYLNPIILKVLD
jgi:hypothetical protein